MLWAWMMFLTRKGWWRRKKGSRKEENYGWEPLCLLLSLVLEFNAYLYSRRKGHFVGVCLYRGSLQEGKVSSSLTVIKWRGEVSNIDYDFLTWIWILNSFILYFSQFSLLYILCHPITFCVSGLDSNSKARCVTSSSCFFFKLFLYEKYIILKFFLDVFGWFWYVYVKK